MRAKSFERKNELTNSRLLATVEKERAFLVGVVSRALGDTLRERELAADYGLASDRSTRANAMRHRVEEYLEELHLLAESAGAEVVGTMIQERQAIDVDASIALYLTIAEDVESLNLAMDDLLK